MIFSFPKWNLIRIFVCIRVAENHFPTTQSAETLAVSTLGERGSEGSA
jgi:hypothetical protein